MKKYTYVNTALFKRGAMPLYKVFDTETREITWVAYRYPRGRQVGIAQEFHSRASANAWREVQGSQR